MRIVNEKRVQKAQKKEQVAANKVARLQKKALDAKKVCVDTHSHM